MAVGRRVLALFSAAFVLTQAGSVRAEDLMYPAPPVEAGTPQGGQASPFSALFSPPAKPMQPWATPLDIRPVMSSLPVTAKAESGPKRTNIPSPPRPERPAPALAGANTVDANTRAATTPPQSSPSAPPLQGGFFSWLAKVNSEQVGEPQRVASLAPVTSSLGSATDALRSKRRPGDNLLDDDFEDEEPGRLVEKQTDHVNIACLKPDLMRLIRTAGEHFKGTPVITSGFRGHGRRGSYHRKCEAADFFIAGVSSGSLISYLKSLPGAGGVGTYCHTKSVHIDTGEPRNWHQCGRRRSFALREPVVRQIGSR